MELAKKTVRLLVLFTLGFAAVYIVSSLVGYGKVLTSFPWWSCLLIAAMYFGPVLAFEGILYLILILIEKHRK